VPFPHPFPTRRRFLRLAGAAAAGTALTGGCGPSPSDPHTLRVFVYAGNHERVVPKVFVPAFEAKAGARVALDAGWWDAIARLKAAPKDNPPFDLMITDAKQGYPAAREGLFGKLNLDNIPSCRNLAPAALDNWIYQQGYGVTYPDSAMTLAYRPDSVGFTPSRWDDLVRDDVNHKIALYDSFYMSLYTFAAMKAAREGTSGTAHEAVERDLDGVMAFAKENRDRVAFWWPTSTDMLAGLSHKDSVMGNMHSPEMLRALREQPELAAVAPEQDRAFVQVFWAVPAGAPKKDLAEAAIDMIFGEDMQLAFARQGSAAAVPAVARQVAAEDPVWKRIYPSTDEQFQSLRYYPYDAYFKDWDRIHEVWQREVLRNG
jgi:spermidine/putrescine-binding protein